MAVPPPFAAAAQAGLSAAFDQFAEDLAFTPMAAAKDVNAASVPDPAREQATLRGIFYDPRARALIPNGFDPRTDQRPGTVSGTPRFELYGFDRTIVVGIRKGDILQRFDGADGAPGSRWVVSSTFVKPQGVVVLNVNAI